MKPVSEDQHSVHEPNVQESNIQESNVQATDNSEAEKPANR